MPHPRIHRRRAALIGFLMVAACAPATPADAIARAVEARDSLAQADAESAARTRQDSINRAQPGYVVDSILPLEEEMRRFRESVGGARATILRGGSTSEAELVDQFARALSAGDSTALRRLAVSPREFIDLVYPQSPYTKPPYRQPPGLLWSQIQRPSGSGLRRLLERHGGQPFHIESLSCPDRGEWQGANLLHANCRVRFVSGKSAPRDGRLFGTILERGGEFKFVSYANMY